MNEQERELPTAPPGGCFHCAFGQWPRHPRCKHPALEGQKERWDEAVIPAEDYEAKDR